MKKVLANCVQANCPGQSQRADFSNFVGIQNSAGLSGVWFSGDTHLSVSISNT